MAASLFKQHFKISGEIVAVYEEQGLSDYVQTGFPRPYDRFEPLNYANPSLANLADQSADLITCYVGLHHFEEDKLHPFLDEIKRVLRPEGHFLLVDHDVTNEITMSMAHMAHSIFNAVTGVSLEEELRETRHFHSMTHWQEVLRAHDLGNTSAVTEDNNIRAGDPSRNKMMCFQKAPALILDLPAAATHGVIKPENRRSALTELVFAENLLLKGVFAAKPPRSNVKIEIVDDNEAGVHLSDKVLAAPSQQSQEQALDRRHGLFANIGKVNVINLILNSNANPSANLAPKL
jgi:SAM-dependent methyltransferase